MDEIIAKRVYVCGPLTELSELEQKRVKNFYSKIADICEKVSGTRAFVPHEHYDPVINASYTPREVDKAERHQVCECTSILIVAAIGPSWGGGIEVEMAYRSGVPIILLCERQKLEQRKISRLLRGNPAVIYTVVYKNKKDALNQLADILREWTGPLRKRRYVSVEDLIGKKRGGNCEKSMY